MRKFKLIKEYPGSPELGTVVTKDIAGRYIYMLSGGEKTLHGTDIENQPEYWKEIKSGQEDYEILEYRGGKILSVKRTRDNEIFSIGDKVVFYSSELRKKVILPIEEIKELRDDCGAIEWWISIWAKNSIESLYVAEKITEEKKNYKVLTLLYENKVYTFSKVDATIYSVKRLSDGEVFAVGDRAKTITSKGNHIIESFEIKQKQIDRNTYDGLDRIWVNWDNSAGGNWLDKIEHYKKYLFTTEDGVDIYEGDKYYSVHRKGLKVVENSEYSPNQVNLCDWKRFSTREKAEEYILLNKPCLSIKDIIDYFDDLPLNEQPLKELVKSKM